MLPYQRLFLANTVCWFSESPSDWADFYLVVSAVLWCSGLSVCLSVRADVLMTKICASVFFFIDLSSLLLQVISVYFPLIDFNPLKPELNPISYLLELLGAHHFLHVSRIRVKLLTLR